tara:strand:+ start:1050 stop:2633 length:1584 start_codon:yes stop_codon:yes gene_type:complete
MITSLYAGVSGIKNLQKKLDILGNNIANVNTNGYKRSRLTFSDSFNQVSKNGKLGTGTTNTQTLFNQGMLEATGNITDLAIQGNSFFVLNDGGKQAYSRDGSFYFDANQNLVNNTGMKVKGWIADSAGQITVSETLEDIKIDTGMTSSPIATQNIRLAGNLSSTNTATASVWQLTSPMNLINDSSASNINQSTSLSEIEEFSDLINDDGQLILDLTGSKLFDGTSIETNIVSLNANNTIEDLENTLESIFTGTTVSLTASNQIEIRDIETGEAQTHITIANLNPIQSSNGTEASSISASTVIYDSLGESHNLIFKFTPLENNTWSWVAETANNEEIISGGSGTVQFDSNGNLIENSFNFEQEGMERLIINDGQSNLEINIDVDGHNGISGLSANGSMSTLTAIEQDGRSTGNFENMFIENSGQIIAQFTNGDTRTIAQLATASFKNPSGLEKYGGNSFIESIASGNVTIDSALNSNSSIVSGALEMSNVDLANEFTDMIISQRGFQASTKVVSTTDQILEEAINLKR